MQQIVYVALRAVVNKQQVDSISSAATVSDSEQSVTTDTHLSDTPFGLLFNALAILNTKLMPPSIHVCTCRTAV